MPLYGSSTITSTKENVYQEEYIDMSHESVCSIFSDYTAKSSSYPIGKHFWLKKKKFITASLVFIRKSFISCQPSGRPW
jgi:hypothetical protein